MIGPKVHPAFDVAIPVEQEALPPLRARREDVKRKEML